MIKRNREYNNSILVDKNIGIYFMNTSSGIGLLFSILRICCNERIQSRSIYINNKEKARKPITFIKT